jgi:hypothetical protein
MTRHRRPSGPTLFAAEEMTLRPSPQVRLRQIAARSPRNADRPFRFDEDLEVMNRLRGWGADLSRRFGLRYKSLDPEQDGVVEHYGVCYEDGVIRIRLRHATTKKLLKESSLVDTLCHELAHLRHLDHSIRFRRLYAKILDKARQLGYYRPGPTDARKPRQLTLFDPRACGTDEPSTRRSTVNARSV